jgi:glycosyltransferase involved in cell wall biosynthesis
MIDALVGNDYSICLCSALNTLGVDVELIAPENRSADLLVNFPIRHWMPSKGLKGSKFTKTIRYLGYLAHLLFYVIKHSKEQRIIHFQFFRRERVESLVFPLLRLFGANLVFTAHNVLPHENNAVDRFLRHIIYRSAKIIVVHSEYVKNKLSKNFKINQEKIKIIAHGNFDHYAPKEPMSKVEARTSLKLSKMDRVALFFGFIREYKGLDLLLDAFELCAKKGAPLKLVIAGATHPQELENYYRKRISQISTDGSILFHAGFIPSEEVALYFIACDVVVLPYREIDHSGIVHLAYSFGRPLITTNVGDFPEIIEDGRSGYLLKENNAECLSETLFRALSSSPRLKEMGSYARYLGETKYSWTDIAYQMRDLYTTLV